MRARDTVTARHAALPMAATASALGVARKADAAKSAAARKATIAACRRRVVRFHATRFFQTIAISGRPRGARANGTAPRRARSAARREAWASVASSNRTAVRATQAYRTPRRPRAGGSVRAKARAVGARRGPRIHRNGARSASGAGPKGPDRSAMTSPPSEKAPRKGPEAAEKKPAPNVTRRIARAPPEMAKAAAFVILREAGGSSFQRAFVNARARLWK